MPIPQITHYAAEDADVVWRIRPALERRLADAGLQKLFETVEVPLVEVLTELEYNGIRVDRGPARRIEPPIRRKTGHGRAGDLCPGRPERSTSARRSNCKRCCSTS